MFEELKSKRILITGATGLVGQALIKVAFQNNMRIIAVVRDVKKAKKLFSAIRDITYIESDLLRIPLKNYGVDYIIHAAANTSSKAFVEEPVNIIDNTFSGTKHVLELAKINQVKSLVFLSSMEIYGPQKTDEKIEETHSSAIDTMIPRFCYPEAKRISENLCASYYSQYDVPAKVVRLTQTFGPGVRYNDGRVFAEFARCVIEEKDIILHTKGETRRSYLYTEDAAMAIFTVMIKGIPGEAYNAANEETYCTIYEMAKLVAQKCAHNRIKVIIKDDNDGTYGYAPTLHMNLDTSKLKALGWQPSTNLEDIYKFMIESMINNDEN